MVTAALTAPIDTTVNERWMRVGEVMQITSLGRTFLYAEMSAGRLKSVKAGGARRVRESDLKAWMASFNGAGSIES